MDMEKALSDRLWDKDVQGFIEACQSRQLSDVTLDYTVRDDGRKILNVRAIYGSRTRGPIHIGYRWTENRRTAWTPEIFVGRHTAPAAHHVRAFLPVALRAGYWRDRKNLSLALLAVTQVFFRAQMVRGGLDREHLQRFADEEAPIERAQGLTLQTLNDLAFLYSGPGMPGR